MHGYLRVFGRRQWVGSEAEFGDNFATNEVFLNDPLGVFGGYLLVPGSFGVDDGDGAAGADAEAVALGSITGAVGAGDVELLHALFDVIPRLLARLGVDAIGAGADKEVAAELAHSKLGSHSGRGQALWVGHRFLIVLADERKSLLTVMKTKV
jgi:hypothetical protein